MTTPEPRSITPDQLAEAGKVANDIGWLNKELAEIRAADRFHVGHVGYTAKEDGEPQFVRMRAVIVEALEARLAAARARLLALGFHLDAADGEKAE